MNRTLLERARCMPSVGCIHHRHSSIKIRCVFSPSSLSRYSSRNQKSQQTASSPPNQVPIKTLLIDGNCRVDDCGLKSQHGHMATFNIQEALEWKGKFEQVIDQIQYRWSPVITNTTTTMQVIVPQSIVACIYGEGGGCLEQIRQFSDANISIPEAKGGAKETVIVISGTPEQAYAAQSVIQAFVMLEAANEDGQKS